VPSYIWCWPVKRVTSSVD